MRQMGTRATGNEGSFEMEFGAVPAGTQIVEVVFNGTLRKVAMSQAEWDRHKTPGAELFPALPPGTTARAAVVRDPVEVDLTDRSPKEFDSGLGWKYVFERVIATSARIGVTYHVEGIARDRLYPNLAQNLDVDGELRFNAGPETTIFPLGGDGSQLVLAIGPGSRWVAEPIRATFTRNGGSWTTWNGTFALGSFAATLSDGPGIVVRETSDAILLGGPVSVTLTDDLGVMYRHTGSTGGIPVLDLKFERPAQPCGNDGDLERRGLLGD